MTRPLLIGTRKGLIALERDDSLPQHYRIAAHHFVGEPVSMVLPDGRDGSIYAALNLGHFGVKLHRLAEGATQWTPCNAPAYPPKPESAAPTAGTTTGDSASAASADAGDPTPWSLEQIWSLETGGADEPGTLWAGTIPGGLFRSDDHGQTWTLNRALWDRPECREWFGGGYDHAGIHSIMVDPRDSRHVTLGISCGGVWQTRDRGETWALTARGMSADYMPPERTEDGNVQDPHRIVQCASAPDALWCQHHCAIFRSTDGAANWQRIEAQPSSFGFAVAAHPSDPETAWFVPAVKDACRIPVDGKLVVTRTRDGGRTFESFDTGLPAAPAFDLVYRHGLAIDPTGAQLAMGSTTGGLWTSEDGGESWTEVSAHFPPIYCVRFG
jgi:photosystem II stability/assembly factor-like uncharacterized protein